MTKKEAEKEFRRETLPFIREVEQEAESGDIDRTTRHASWNEFMGALFDVGSITKHQHKTWALPDFC